MHHSICADTGDEYRDKCIVLLRNALIGHKRPLTTKEQELYAYWKAATVELCVYRQHHQKVDEEYVEEIHRKIILICDPTNMIRENLIDGSLSPQKFVTDTLAGNFGDSGQRLQRPIVRCKRKLSSSCVEKRDSDS